MRIQPTGLFVLCAALCACAGTGEIAQVSSERQIARDTLLPMFYVLDCTDQGFLEAGEIAEHMAQIFRPFDRDNSRTLSRGEFSRAGNYHDAGLLDTAFTMSDANADGAVNSQEYRYYLERLIRTMDTDSNGELTLAELQVD